MKDLLSRIGRLELRCRTVKPVMIIRTNEGADKAQQEYQRHNGFIPDKVIQIVKATREH